MRVLAPVALVLGACSFPGIPSWDPADQADGDPAGTADGPPPGEPDATPPADAEPALECPSPYDQEYGGHFYKFSNTKRTWADAEDDCEGDDDGKTHLIAIDDDDEWSALVTGAALAHGGEWQLVGVVRDIESTTGPWRTVTGGEAPVVKWRVTIVPPSSEPTDNGTGTAEPVMAIDPGFDFNHLPTAGGFLDVSVEFQAYYVCECDGRPAVDADYD